jgi:hypothetical protein
MSIIERLRADGEAPAAAIDIGDALDLLANERRRHILRVVADQRGAIDIGDLADCVTVRENGQLIDDERKNVWVGCYQTHLPKLDRYGAVDCGQQCKHVRATDETHALVAALDAVEDALGGGA